MNRLRSLSLGTKLNLALLAFLLLLGAATLAIIVYGFERTRDNADERSAEALEEGGRLALQAVAGSASEQGGLLFEAVGEVGRRSALFMEAQDADTSPAPALVPGEDDNYIDPDPDRVTDLTIVSGAPAPDDPRVVDDIAFSAPLNTVFPVLLQSFAGEVGGTNLDPIAITFISTNGVARLYPPAGAHEVRFGFAALAERMAPIGPDQNAARETIWTAPYDGDDGRGLIVTARTPVYDGDVFRGAIEVDVSMGNVFAQINRVRPTPRAFAFYVDREGTLLEGRSFPLLNNESTKNPVLAQTLDSMRTLAPNTTIDARVQLAGEDYFIAYTRVLVLGGTFAVAAPVTDLTAATAGISSGIDDEGARTLQVTVAAMSILFVVGLAGAGFLNRHAVIKPINRLVAAARAVGAGDLEARVPVSGGGDEFDELGVTFNTMVEQLRESERSLEGRVEQRTRELDALLRADSDLFHSLDLDTVLAALVDIAIDIVGADKCLVTLWDRERSTVTIRAERGYSAEGLRLLTELMPAPGMGSIPDDIAITVHKMDDPAMPSELRAVAELERVNAAMEVPIRSATGVVLGGYGVGYTRPHEFTDDEKRLLMALADRAAVALQNAELFERAQQAASLEERQRLARELHDSVSQALYGIALGTRTARLRLGEDPHNAAEPIDYVASLAQAGLAEMRALIFELRPESLEQEGLVAAIEKHAASTRARYGLDVRLELMDEPECSIEVKEALYRIAQEAIHNVVKHANAQRVRVSLQADGDHLNLTVADDGQGFDTSASFPGHVGLQSMPERAGRLGGSVDVTSEAGVGTQVVAWLPIGTV